MSGMFLPTRVTSELERTDFRSPSELQDLASQFGVKAMPTFIAFRNGEQVEQIVGADQSKIVAVLEEYVSLQVLDLRLRLHVSWER